MSMYHALHPGLPEVGSGLAQDMAFRSPQYTEITQMWRKTITRGERNLSYPYQFIDETIQTKVGNPAAYRGEAFQRLVCELRSETRNFTYMLLLGQVPDLTVRLIEWATRKIEPNQHKEMNPVIATIINYLKEDTLYSFAHIPLYAQESSPYSLSSLITPEMLIALSPRAFPAVQQDTVGIEVGWLIASHEETPTDILLQYEPQSPQWYTVVAHKNYPVEYLHRIIDMLYQKAQVEHIDTKMMEAIFLHPSWDETMIRKLLIRTPNEQKAFLTPYLINHSQCPVDLLEAHEDFLSLEGTVRLATITKNQSILSKLAYHPSEKVRQAIQRNYYSTEETRIIAALCGVES